MACSRRDTILLAAEKGIGALSFAFVEPEDAEHWVDDYEAVLADRCVPVGLSVNPQVACVTPMMCAPSEEEALARGLEGANFFGYSLAHFYVFGDHVPASTDVWEEFLERRGKMGYSPEAALATRHETLGAKAAAGDQTGLRGAIGTPDQLRRVPPPLRGGRRRPADLRHAGRAQPPRAHHGVDRAVRHPRSCPSSSSGTRRRSGPRRPAWNPWSNRPWPAGSATTRPCPPDYMMRAIPKQMVEALADEPAQQWLESLADKQAAGVHDEEFQRLVDG